MTKNNYIKQSIIEASIASLEAEEAQAEQLFHIGKITAPATPREVAGLFDDPEEGDVW